jgi:hypothetical protein
MSFMSRVAKFTKSPQGKKLIKQAEQMAKDPRTKKKVADARDRLQHKDEPGSSAQPKSGEPR